VRSLLALTLVLGCAEPEDDRQSVVVSALAEADRSLLRTRPDLMAGKLGRMARDLYDYYRGNVPVFAVDFRNGETPASPSRFRVDSVLPLSTGDAHPENFGVLLAGDGTLALEPNDFDGADRYPYLWDLRRLTTGMVLAARLANPEDPVAREESAAAAGSVVRATAGAYWEHLGALATGTPRTRVTESESAHVEDLFERGLSDLEDRCELEELTELVGGARLLRRGVLEDDPEEMLQDVPVPAREALRDTLRDYVPTLVAPPEDPRYFEILDVARQLGTGVSSWARIRVLVLVRGPSDDPDDDVILEVKEMTDSSAEGWIPPRRYYDDVAHRVRETSRALWARPDAEALWGTSWWLGMRVQVRLESEAQKTLRVRRMSGRLGRPENLITLGAELGRMLARMHATPLDGEPFPQVTIFSALDDREGFVEEQVVQSQAYADQQEIDWQLFRDAVRRDPTLGVLRRPGDQPRPEVMGVLGVPAPANIP